MQLAKFFITIISVSLLITLASSWLLKKGLLKTGSDFYGRVNASRDSNKATSLLIVGSSRALRHLDTRILDKATGLNSYNYGLSACSIKTCDNIIRSAIRYQKKARVLLLNIDYHMFDTADDPYKDTYYYPYQNDIPGILMTNTGTADLIHKAGLFDVCLYDDDSKYAAVDGWLKPGRERSGYYKGYNPHEVLNDYKTAPYPGSVGHYIKMKEDGFNELKDCIDLCKSNNIKLVFLLAPYYKQESPEKYFANFKEVINRVKEIATLSKIPFYNYMDLQLCNDKKYFFDQLHLNATGAAIYSQAVADSLQKFFYEQSVSLKEN